MILETRKNLNAQSLYRTAKELFLKKFPNPERGSSKSQKKSSENKIKIPKIDCIMSCVALFSLKFLSLLQYNKQRCFPRIAHNLKTLFGVQKAPSDTSMRESLDTVNPQDIRGVFKPILAHLQRGKALEPYVYLEKKYLLSMDGTGHFSSPTIHCKNCCVKEHKNGTKTFHHQMLAAVIVHPDQKQVIPLAPEPILKQDGATKNDCERSAAKRLLADIRREHPHLPLIVVEDSLASNGPHIKELQKHNMSYILGVKPGDHAFLLDWIKDLEMMHHEEIDSEGTKHIYSFANEVPLNDANFDLKINFLAYWEIEKKGKEQHFSWVTDFTLTKENVKSIMRGGRERWRIENNTFNTLKNQGYNFEHNFGHGYENLCAIMGFLMMLAFFIDQAQELCCMVFKKARKLTGRYTTLWETMRILFISECFENWNDLFFKIIELWTPPEKNTS